MGVYTASGQVSGDGNVQPGHSIALQVPNIGASFDFGVQGDPPPGAPTGSLDIGYGKHLGVSANVFLDDKLKPHVYGATIHIGTPALIGASPVGATVDLPTKTRRQVREETRQQ